MLSNIAKNPYSLRSSGKPPQEFPVLINNNNNMSGNNGPPTDDLNAALVSALAKLDGNKKN